MKRCRWLTNPILALAFSIHCRAHNFTNFINKGTKCNEYHRTFIWLHCRTPTEWLADVAYAHAQTTIVDWQGNDSIVWVCGRIVAVSMDRIVGLARDRSTAWVECKGCDIFGAELGSSAIPDVGYLIFRGRDCPFQEGRNGQGRTCSTNKGEEECK
jgi:hypothetical protein